jgi:intermediate peptidase
MRRAQPIFHFRGCLNAPRLLKVLSNTYTTVIKPSSAIDKTLVEFFDQQPHPPRPQNKGFLLNKQIISPGDFKPVTLYTLRRAQCIVERILRASSEEEQLRLVTDIDRLSDTLCRLVDLAELVRNTHPDKAWVEAANQTYDDVLVYMNGLNTTPELAQVSTN